MDFMRWVVETFEVEVRTAGYDQDLTTAIRESGVESVYPEYVRSAPLPWAESLLPLGFFWDLEHELESPLSLEDACRDMAAPDEARLVGYLESGQLYRQGTRAALDRIDMSDDDVVIGQAHLLTDGVYVWPAELAYYVARYHLRLPRHFVLHAQVNSWRVADVDVSMLPSLPGIDGEEHELPPPLMGAAPSATAQSLLVDGAGVVLGKELRYSESDAVREGYLALEPSTRVLATLTMQHAESYPLLQQQLAFDDPAITPLHWIGPLPADGTGHRDALIEVLPAGRRASELAPIAESAVGRMGVALASVLARAHARGLVLVGIVPDLIYIDGDLAFTAIAPRGPAFIASAPQVGRGLRSYVAPYVTYESLTHQPLSAATDVFSLCATLFVLATGRHPFGDPQELGTLVSRMTSGDLEPYPGSAAMGALLARGMARDPADRPTAVELADALEMLSA